MAAWFGSGPERVAEQTDWQESVVDVDCWVRIQILAGYERRREREGMMQDWAGHSQDTAEMQSAGRPSFP